jgi:hypothetical protein
VVQEAAGRNRHLPLVAHFCVGKVTGFHLPNLRDRGKMKVYRRIMQEEEPNA